MMTEVIEERSTLKRGLMALMFAGIASGVASATHPPFNANASRWLLDRPHDVVSESVLAVSDRFDRFFDVSGEDQTGDTRVRITTGTEFREGKSVEWTAGAGARIDLPHLQRRWNLLFENIDITEETLTEQDAGDDFSAGLRFLVYKTLRTWIDIDGGLRFADGPMAFGRLRLRRKHLWERDLARFTQAISWETADGFVGSSRLEHERTLGAKYLTHTHIEADWGESTDGVEWRGGPSLKRLLRYRHGWALFCHASGTTHPPNRVDQYHAGIRYRNRLYRNWLFLDIVPSLEFNDAGNFKPEPVLNLQLEAIFGRL